MDEFGDGESGVGRRVWVDEERLLWRYERCFGVADLVVQAQVE